VYRPTTGTDRTVSFALESGVALYGGFAGSETLREQRDWETNVTTLSGDIGVAEDSSDNSYHVVVALYWVDATATLDGFTVRGGNADGEIDDAYGGGLFNRYFDLKEGLERIFGRPVDVVVERAVVNPYFKASIERSRKNVYAA
jgi:hypothetical protein